MKKIFFLFMMLGIVAINNADAQNKPAPVLPASSSAGHALVNNPPSSAPNNGMPPEDSLPYRKYPTLPAFKILEMDSSTVFNTYDIPEGKPTVLMLFSPDCDHCKHLTEKLTSGMDSLKDVQIYMMTPVSSITELRDFYVKYHLADYKNIKIVGRDTDFFFFSFYGARFVPYLALYDKHKKLIKTLDTNISVKEIYELTRDK
jgi:hypothetical protein